MFWKSLLFLALAVGATAADLKDTSICQDCRKIVSFATQFNSSTQRQEYTDLIKRFCESRYPASNDFQEGPCPMFIKALFYVMDNTDPVTHCDSIGVCGPKQPSDDMYQYLQSSNNIADTRSQPADRVVCDFCQNLVDQFKAALTNPDSVKMIYHSMDKLCDYLALVGQDGVCKELVAKYLRSFLALVQRIDAKQYCASIHMCPIRSTKSSQEQTQLPTLADFSNFGLETSVSIAATPSDLALTEHRNGPACILCKRIIKEMFNFLRENKTEANIIKGLDHVCQILYPNEPKLSECESMVKAYTREIVQLLMDETDPEMICMLLEQCVYNSGSTQRQINQELSDHSSTTRRPVATNVQVNDLAHLITALEPSINFKSLRACVECKMFIKFLKDELDNQRSQAEIKQWLLSNLCQELPSNTLVESCSTMVENYSDVFFKAVSGDLNPQAACVELGVCKSKNHVQVFDGLSESPSISLNQLRINALKTPMMSKEMRCTTCTDVVSFIDDYLATHPTSEDIATASKVCDRMTDQSQFRNECLTIVKQHDADIIELIPTMESPRHLCQKISLC